MFGLTWAVVAALKDTHVDRDTAVMTVKGDGSKVVQVASYEYLVTAGGIMAARNGGSIKILHCDLVAAQCHACRHSALHTAMSEAGCAARLIV